MGKFSHSAQAEDIQSSGAAQVDKPYMGPSLFQGGGAREIGKDDEFSVIQFDFKLTGNAEQILPMVDPLRQKGQVYSHTEWEPREDDKEEKVHNQFNRIGYILKYLVGDALATRVINVDGDSYAEAWDQLRTNVDKVLNKPSNKERLKDKPVMVKILGSVYNNEGRVGFPNYLAFLADEESNEALAIGKKERQSNVDYMAWLEASSSAEAAAPTAPAEFEDENEGSPSTEDIFGSAAGDATAGSEGVIPEASADGDDFEF